MDRLLNEYVVRSIQKDFVDNWPDALSTVAVFYDGQKFDPSQYDETVQVTIDGPHWTGVQDDCEVATVYVDVKVFCKLSADIHRIHELAGAVANVLHSRRCKVMDYPAAEATQVDNGWVFYGAVELNAVPLEESHSAGGGTVPLRQINVSADATVSLNS